ncbi:MAG: addiction module toxin RelE [Pyrinomonadaceae bacterium]|nr:addiction module toxin RelE [Pyrinomonadaceae bacterium]
MNFTTIEYKEFTKSSDRLLGRGENDRVVDALSGNPRLGDLIGGTGGIRKLKWPINCKTKNKVQGIVHFYFKDKSHPVHLIAVFKPGAKQTLAKAIEIIVGMNE